MALKKPIEVYSGWNDVYFSVKVGESILVKDVLIHKFNTSCDLVRMYVDSVLVGEFYVGDIFGNPFELNKNLHNKRTLLQYLFEKGIWRGIPVEEGQTFRVTAVNGTGVNISIIYEVYDAPDMPSTNPNGSDASERDLITYGIPLGTLVSENLYNSCLYGKIVGGFPFEDKVPPAYEVYVKGVLFQDIYKSTSTGANKSRTLYLKFIKEREVLYNSQLAGLPYVGDSSQSGDGTFRGYGNSIGGVYTTNNTREPFILPEPIVNFEGEKLEIYVGLQTITGSINITNNDLLLGLIVTQKRIR